MKADLHGTIFAYVPRMQLFQRALLVSGKDSLQLIILTFWLWLPLSYGFKTCFKIL